MIGEPRTQRMCRGLAAVAAALALLVPVAGRSPGQSPNDESLTWPPISVSTAIIERVVVAQGRTLDRSQRMVWQVPLAPAGGGILMEHSLGSTFVQVSGRQFVIDDATGAVQEMRPGQVVRKLYPLRPPIPQVTPIPAPSGAPSPTPAPNAAIQSLADASQKLLAALTDLDEKVKLQQQGRADAAQVEQARRQAAVARDAVDKAQKAAMAKVAPEMAVGMPRLTGATPARPSSMPVTGAAPKALSPEVKAAQTKVLDLTSQYVLAQADLDRVSRAQPADATAVADATKKVQDMAGQLDSLDRELQKLRFVDEVRSLAKLDPKLRDRLDAAEERVMTKTAEYHAAEAGMLTIREALDLGQATKDQFGAAQAKMMDAMRDLAAARRDLETARREGAAQLSKQGGFLAPASRPATP